MSDKLKKEYNEYMNQIGPGKDFLVSLQDTLHREEKAANSRRRFRLIKQLSAVAAGILLCTGIIFAVNIIRHNSESQTGNPGNSNNHGEVIKQGETAGISGTDSVNDYNWITDDLKEYPLPKALSARLTASLDDLFVSDTNRFVDAPKAGTEEISEIADRLDSATETDITPEGTPKYYMAVFDDMTLVKFSIAENGVISINGTEKYFR